MMVLQATTLRFAFVGMTVAATYVALYLGLLALGVQQFVANSLAFLLAVALQYVAQAAFTFARKLNDLVQALRFAVMICLGLLVSTLITGVLGPMFGLSDVWAALAVTAFLPIVNFAMMTLWVFSGQQTNADNS